jgi:hypothetical protein
MVRARIFFPSAAPWVNGILLHRVQTVGSTTTFTTEDIFELGTSNIIDVVDDTPAVAVTIETNDFGSIETIAAFAGVDNSGFGSTAVVSNSNLVVLSGTTVIDYLHGVRVLDFATDSDNCGDEAGFDMWVPIQDECEVGTNNNIIEMTQYMSKVFVNSVDLNYAVGANATENYAAETEDKLWLLNDARHVTYERIELDAGLVAAGFVTLAIDGPGGVVPTLSDGNLAFLKVDEDGNKGVLLLDSAGNLKTRWGVLEDTVALVNFAAYNPATNDFFFPTSASLVPVAGDIIVMTYAADEPGDQALTTAGPPARTVASAYYETLDNPVGAVRQGQIEAYLIDPRVTTSFDRALRLQTVTASVDLTREPLSELGRLRPYERPVTIPIPITATVETTASDLKQWAIFAAKEAEFDAGTLDDIDVFDLLAKKDNMLVIKLFQQTDEEAGGTGANRKVLTEDLLGRDYSLNGDVLTYASTVPAVPEREYALKTVVLPDLVIEEEAFNVTVGDNATQTFNFRANNKMLFVQGDIDFSYLLLDPGIVKNT